MKTTKIAVAAATTFSLCAVPTVRAAVTVSEDETWSSGSYSESVVIDGGAKLTVNGDVSVAAAVDVGGANGGGALEIAGATLANTASRIRFNVGLPGDYAGPRSSPDYVSELILKTGGVAKSSAGLSQNGAFDSRVRFEGGQLMFNSYASRALFSAAGSAMHLEGLDGNDIDLFFSYTGGRTLYLMQDWSAANTATRLAFAGDCDVVLDANDSTALHMQVYGSSAGDKLASGYKTVAWGQTGNLVLKKNIQMTLDGDMMLPFGAQTGGVVLDAATARLDFNGRRTAVNAITATQGLVTNSAATAATLVLGLDNADATLSGIVKADLKGDFNYEKAGSGTLTIDKGAYGTLTVAEGEVAFAATAATPAGGAVSVDALVIDSADMATLLVDGVALTVGTAGGTALGGVAVVTRNGGSFTCGAWNASEDAVSREPSVASGDTLVKFGSGTTTLASTNSLPSLDVRAGTIRFRTPYLTGGSKMMLKYTFKKTSGTNQKLCFEEIRVRGWNNVGNWTDNAIAAHQQCLDRYPVRGSIADAFADGGMWVNGEYLESSTGSNRALPYSPSFLFDNGTSTTRVYNPTNTIPNPADAATWQQVAFRVYWWQSVIKLAGYNFTKGLYQQNVGLPVTWTVEASTNGTDWAVVDERADIVPPAAENWNSKVWYNGGTDFPLIGLGPERGIGASAAVRVDSGATLDLEGLADAERTISNLTIDMAAGGGGRITTFVPAANGVLDIVNLQGTLNENTDLGLTFDSIVGAGNLSTWTVRANGVAKTKRIIARDGKLVVVADATVMYVR